MEKDATTNEKTGVAILITDKTDSKSKNITRVKEDIL